MSPNCFLSVRSRCTSNYSIQLGTRIEKARQRRLEKMSDDHRHVHLDAVSSDRKLM
jgi:hypothetical protein